MVAGAEAEVDGDKNYHGKAFEADLTDADVKLPRLARKTDKHGPYSATSKRFRQVIESVNNTLKNKLDLDPTVGAPSPESHRAYCNASSASLFDLAQRPTGRPASFANRLRSLSLGITHRTPLAGLDLDERTEPARVLGVHLVLLPSAFLDGQPHRVFGVIHACLRRHLATAWREYLR